MECKSRNSFYIQQLFELKFSKCLRYTIFESVISASTCNISAKAIGFFIFKPALAGFKFNEAFDR